jgi:hypothetical protein
MGAQSSKFSQEELLLSQLSPLELSRLACMSDYEQREEMAKLVAAQGTSPTRDTSYRGLGPRTSSTPFPFRVVVDMCDSDSGNFSPEKVIAQ